MSDFSVKIIPTPKSVSKSGVTVISPTLRAAAKYSDSAAVLTDYANRIFGVTLSSGDAITLSDDPSLGAGEYSIEITDGAANLFASDTDGMGYAVATLIQLIDMDGERIAVPKVKITDRPDCNFRAFMVDLARKWHPFECVLGYVDLCYLYKIKFLHLHFIDTQSYTLPSDKFPKMPTPDRHYTKEQITELNSYAASHGIEIIPEMEVPGHAAAMVGAYPELFADTPIGADVVDTYSLFNNTHKRNIVCVGKPGVMDTLRTLAKEIIEMFPASRYLHIGGDEAKISDWGNCRDCLEYMKQNGIDGPKPLYTHFVKKMTDMVLELGKTPMVWEGFPRDGADEISRDVIVTAWESYYHLAPELIAEGFKITNSSWQPLYIVPAGHRYVTTGHWEPEEILDWNIYNWQNWNPKTAAYQNPINVDPTDSVLGATLCAWECTYEQEIEPVKRNLAAMSERVWNVSGAPEKAEFLAALDRLVAIAEKLLPKV